MLKLMLPTGRGMKNLSSPKPNWSFCGASGFVATVVKNAMPLTRISGIKTMQAKPGSRGIAVQVQAG
ncbi:hypothetical protein [Burkholderia stabilis]|uniref:hypothetical protein n=1 Tax=Burkholderia stabilis TaxID=95485 RepID=UPI0012FE5ADB|nr:hypothetical protein [Burkholderia stabilis]